MTEDKVEFTKEVHGTRVRVGVKYLHNLGNFENISLDFEIETAQNPGETIDAALDRVYLKVDEHLRKRIKDLVADRR